MKDAVTEDESNKWKEAMNKKIKTLQGMQCRILTNRPPKEKVLHPKFVLRQKMNKQGDVVKYKARLVVCGIVKDGFHDESFTPAADFTIAKIVMRKSLQRR